VEVVPLEEIEEPPPPAEPDDLNATSSPLASSPAFAANIRPEARPSRSPATAAVAVGVVILVLGLSGILIWAFGRSKRETTVVTPASDAGAEPSVALIAASTVPENADTVGRAEAVADAGSTLEPTQPATTPETSESRRSARPDKQEARPIEGVPAPTRGQKGFRPSGI
jgi:hypothetical protein